jgi:phosphate transport system protein
MPICLWEKENQVRRLSMGIEQLHAHLLAMSGLVERNIYCSVASLENRDEALARQVLADEALVNAMEIEVDEQATRLLALHQPVACDLRYLTAVLKINTDLERIGDLAATIARRSLSLLQSPPVKPLVDIPIMAHLVQSMLAESLRAFINRDEDLANQVLRADAAVDALRDSVTSDLVELMKREPGTIERSVDLIFIARSLERIADHAKNIAEDVLFLVRGIDVRHGSSRVA